MFAPFTLITLQAPSKYGEFVFDHWLVNNQPQTTQVPAVAVFLSANTRVEARYRRVSAATSLRLTPIAAPPGQVGFSFLGEPGSTYTLEHSATLTNPAWSPVETRSGNGSSIQFMRSTTASAVGFYRVRVN